MLKRIIIGALLIATPTFATVVSRLEVDHPGLGSAGGSALHTSIEAIYTKIGDNTDSRWVTGNITASGGTLDVDHNFKTAIGDLKVIVYAYVTGSGESTIMVPGGTPDLDDFPVIARVGFETTQVRVTNNSGSAQDVAILIMQGQNHFNNLGVGESVPLGRLHVQNAAIPTLGIGTFFDDLIVENNGDAGMSILGSTSGTSNIAFGDTDNEDSGRISYNNGGADADHMLFYTNDTARFSIDNSGQIYAHQNGTAVSPAYSFLSDQGSGIYGTGTSQILISTNNTEKLKITNSFMDLSLPARADNGSAGSPTFTFNNSTNTGMYLGGSSELLFTQTGALRVEINAGRMETTVPIRVPVGAAGAPTYHFGGAGTTFGFYHDDGVNITTGGVRTIQFQNTANQYMSANADYNFHYGGGVNINLDVSNDLGGDQTFAINTSNGNGRLFDVAENGRVRFWLINNQSASNTMCSQFGLGSLSEIGGCVSSIRYKKDVLDITDEQADRVYKTKPRMFTWKGNGKPDFGFIAEEMNEVIPELTVWGKDSETKDAIITSLNYRHYTALLTKAVQNQKEQIDLMKSYICSQDDAPVSLCD